MQRKHTPRLTGAAQSLRRNMTKEERRLWYDFLRQYPIRFLRQKVIGRYIVDFYFRQSALVIEVDGGQHGQPDAVEYDEIRTRWISQWGLTVMRISNKEVNQNFAAVCQAIDCAVQERIRQ